jgi:hypothetical protein
MFRVDLFGGAWTAAFRLGRMGVGSAMVIFVPPGLMDSRGRCVCRLGSLSLGRTGGGGIDRGSTSFSATLQASPPFGCGEAKPYQVKQFLRLVERYNLQMGEEGESEDQEQENES